MWKKVVVAYFNSDLMLARPVLSYGCEAWTIRRTDERRLISADMLFLRRTAGTPVGTTKEMKTF
jgi:hypothetical protein